MTMSPQSTVWNLFAAFASQIPLEILQVPPSAGLGGRAVCGGYHCLEEERGKEAPNGKQVFKEGQINRWEGAFCMHGGTLSQSHDLQNGSLAV